MTSMRRVSVLLLVALGWGTAAAQPPAQKYPNKVESRTSNVRAYTQCYSGGNSHHGVVVSIDKATMVVRCQLTNDGPEKEFVYSPVDILAKGEVLKSATGGLAYRWQDVKKGDTVRLNTQYDDGEEKWYCLRICIQGRPGEQLPKSPDHENDGRYLRENLLNDLDNGLDVDDVLIAKQFPMITATEPESGRTELIRPAGLPKEYQAKLDAIRAKKKEQAVKAQPPEKKEK
jgi:hypothetical protein